MKLAILRHAGTPDRKLVGLVDEENEAILRGEWAPDTEYADPELPPDDAPEFQAFARSAAVKHAQAIARRERVQRDGEAGDADEDDTGGQSVILEQPAEVYNLLLIGQHPVDRNRSSGTVVHHVQLLPYDHEQVYLDGVVGITILPLPTDGTNDDPSNPVVALYLRARLAEAPRPTDGPRRKMIDRTNA